MEFQQEFSYELLEEFMERKKTKKTLRRIPVFFCYSFGEIPEAIYEWIFGGVETLPWVFWRIPLKKSPNKFVKTYLKFFFTEIPATTLENTFGGVFRKLCNAIFEEISEQVSLK